MIDTLLFDYDHTLAPFKEQAGTDEIKKMLTAPLGFQAEEIGDDFGKIFDLILEILHSNADADSVAMMRSINSYKVATGPEVGNYDIDFLWSREIWLKYLADKYKIELDGRLIMNAIDEYWDAIAQASPLFPDAQSYLSRQKDVGTYVITGSDKRVSINVDGIRYDARYSEKQKLERLKRAGLLGFVNQSNVITGDPFDKPSTEYWNIVVAKAKIKERKNALVIDDSLKVVKSAREFGFRGYIIDRFGIYDKNQIGRDIDGYITNLDQLIIEKK